MTLSQKTAFFAKMLAVTTVVGIALLALFTALLDRSPGAVETKAMLATALTLAMMMYHQKVMSIFNEIILTSTGKPAPEYVGPFSRGQVATFWWVVAMISCVFFL